MVGLNTEIRYLMQLPGHARCLVDAGFGHIKKLYRRSDCETLSDIERVINKSATSNKAILYSPNGQQSWNWKNWKTFLGRQFKALKGIREYQQFRFLAEHPGVVFVKRSEDSTETSVNIHNGLQVTPIHPPTVTAAGLTDARKLYLATHIRPYLRDINKDLTCPQPEE